MAKKWEYSGDISLKYGGFYANLENTKYHYAEVVRITDLDSGCGFTGAVQVEHLTALINPDDTRMDSALECCGMTKEDLPKKNTKAYWMTLIDAALSYGLYDPDDSWANYTEYSRETIQMEKDGPMSFDGWKADTNLAGKSLRRYILNNHL